MKYLKGYSKNRLLGISFSAYLSQTEELHGAFDASNETKFLLGLIEHPLTNGTYALEIKPEYEKYIDSDYQTELVEYSIMNGMGWFTPLPE
jgi:hypothetical protein